MPRLPHRPVVVLLAALGLTVTLLGPTPARSADVPPAEAAPVAARAAGTLSAWGSCADANLRLGGMQCARLTVPLDYSRPAAGSISLAVTRRNHDPGAGTYQGVLLTNPGGPGGSGTWMPLLADYVPGGAGDTYDWIGFDPRGVGASRPALRCSSSYFRYDRPPYVPRGSGLMRYWLRKTRSYSNACGDATAARLLPSMTTRDTVRDMESLRAALQAQRPAAGSKLNFYGYSYGSYLGQVYATQYPARVGRFILDGVVDPTRVWYRANLDQDRHFDFVLTRFFRWLARYPGKFRLGSDWRDIRAGYYRQLRRLEDRPAAGGRLGPAELNDALISAGYSVQSWIGLGYAYAGLVRFRQGGPLLDYLGGDFDDDNGYAVYNAVQCTDVAWPSFLRQRDDTWRIHSTRPFMAWNNTWYNGPCRNWRAPTSTRVNVRDNGVSAKFLLISETQDAATPYSGALRVRSIFPTARLIAGRDGSTHAASLSGVGCVDRAVADYLRTGKTPARRSVRGADLMCPAVPQPDPRARTTAQGMPDHLRDRLMDAIRP